MHSWSHVCTHECTLIHRHTQGEKRSLWKESFSTTHSHTPTRHHVSVLGILLSPPSPEYDMALGLHLGCIHTISLAVRDIWQLKSNSISNDWQMKITEGKRRGLLCHTLLCDTMSNCWCELFVVTFPLLLSHHKEKGNSLILSQKKENPPPFAITKLFWCFSGAAEWIFWYVVHRGVVSHYWGVFFHKYPPLWRPFWSQTI